MLPIVDWLGGSKELAEESYFGICLLDISGSLFGKTFFRKVNILSKIFTLPKYFERVNDTSCLSKYIRTKLFLVLAFEKNSRTAGVLKYDFEQLIIKLISGPIPFCEGGLKLFFIHQFRV